MCFGKKACQQRPCDPPGNVLLKSLGLGMHVDVNLTLTTIVADNVHPFIAMLFPKDIAQRSFGVRAVFGGTK